jgi:hypothetical protein
LDLKVAAMNFTGAANAFLDLSKRALRHLHGKIELMLHQLGLLPISPQLPLLPLQARDPCADPNQQHGCDCNPDRPARHQRQPAAGTLHGHPGHHPVGEARGRGNTLHLLREPGFKLTGFTVAIGELVEITPEISHG